MENDVKHECNNTKAGIGVVRCCDYTVAWQRMQHGAFKIPKACFGLMFFQPPSPF